MRSILGPRSWRSLNVMLRNWNSIQFTFETSFRTEKVVKKKRRKKTPPPPPTTARPNNNNNQA